MKLNDLRDNPGARKDRMCVGRGIGCGKGKTCGRGVKGQKARTGKTGIRKFEGGQMPLIRRIPKRGFNNYEFATRFNPVNVGELNIFEDGARVDETALRSVGLANGRSDGIKILSNGELTKRLTVVASGFSAAAKAKIEAAGGTVEVIVKKTAPKKISTRVRKAAPASKQ